MSILNRVYDAIILGSGPAGLAAALALSRVRRSSLIVSIPNVYRNNASTEMHTFPIHDGRPPAEYRRIAREELNGYGFTTFLDGKAVSAAKTSSGFDVGLEDGSTVKGRKLIIASGSKDVFPDVEGTSSTYKC